MARVTEDEVREIIDNSAGIGMSPFIAAAYTLVNKVSLKDTASELSAADLKEIERWLAAHFYAHRDQLLQNRSTGGASGTFQGQTGMHFESTQYGQTALLLDTTGYLAGLQNQAKEGRKMKTMIWLGSTESEQDSYSSIYDDVE